MPIRISRLNEDKAINGVIFPCDGVPDFPVENQPIISTIHLQTSSGFTVLATPTAGGTSAAIPS